MLVDFSEKGLHDLLILSFERELCCSSFLYSLIFELLKVILCLDEKALAILKVFMMHGKEFYL